MFVIDLPQSNSAPDPRHVDSHNDATLRRLKLSDHHSKIRSTALSQVSQIPEFLLNSSPRFWTIMPYPVPDHIPQVSFLKDSSMTPHNPPNHPTNRPIIHSNGIIQSPFSFSNLWDFVAHLTQIPGDELSLPVPIFSHSAVLLYPGSRTLSPNPAARRHMTT